MRALRAGEAGGTFPEVLANLIITIERQMEFDAQLADSPHRFWRHGGSRDPVDLMPMYQSMSLAK